jgi:hypothetical protein
VIDQLQTLSFPPLVPELHLSVDAGPGCGGIAWPAGEVRRHRFPLLWAAFPTGLTVDRCSHATSAYEKAVLTAGWQPSACSSWVQVRASSGSFPPSWALRT